MLAEQLIAFALLGASAGSSAGNDIMEISWGFLVLEGAVEVTFYGYNGITVIINPITMAPFHFLHWNHTSGDLLGR